MDTSEEVSIEYMEPRKRLAFAGRGKRKLPVDVPPFAAALDLAALF